MTKHEDLDYKQEFIELKRRIRKLETAAPVGYTKITRGALEVESEEGLIVTGSALITGVFRAVGRIILEALGILTINGLVELIGSLKVKAGGDIEVEAGKIKAGDVEIRNGKIYVGTSLVIDPSSNGGSIKFVGGPEIFASGDELDLYSSSGGSYITLDGDAAEIHGPGARWIRVTADGFEFIGMPTIASSAAGGASVGTHWQHPTNNRVYRVVTG